MSEWLREHAPAVHPQDARRAWTAASSGCARTLEKQLRLSATGSMKPCNRSWCNPAAPCAGTSS